MRFYHCGDIGDIILSLPVVKALGGGTIYLDPNGGGHLDVIKKTTWTGRMKFDRAGADYLAPLLAYQDYVDTVELWPGQEYDICLADVRGVFDNQRNIVSHYRRDTARYGPLTSTPRRRRIPGGSRRSRCPSSASPPRSSRCGSAAGSRGSPERVGRPLPQRRWR